MSRQTDYNDGFEDAQYSQSRRTDRAEGRIRSDLRQLTKRITRLEIIVAIALLTPKVGGPSSIPGAIGAVVTWLH